MLTDVLSVYLIDMVSGSVVFSVVHKRTMEPIHVVHSENWVIYSYFSEKTRRTEITSFDLYEGKTQSNTTGTAWNTSCRIKYLKIIKKCKVSFKVSFFFCCKSTLFDYALWKDTASLYWGISPQRLLEIHKKSHNNKSSLLQSLRREWQPCTRDWYRFLTLPSLPSVSDFERVLLSCDFLYLK